MISGDEISQLTADSSQTDSQLRDNMAQATIQPRSYLPPEYDLLDEGSGRSNGFDPAFTADITYRMNVPHRIGVDGTTDDAGNLRNGLIDYRQNGNGFITEMNVPDKLVVVGKDETIGAKDGFKFGLEIPAPYSSDSSSYVNVSTPPRVLTLDETRFPTLDDGLTKTEILEQERKAADELASEYKAMRDGLRPSIGSATPMESSLIYMPERDEAVFIQRHLTRLSRHVNCLEEANIRRGRREMILYPVLIGYAAWCLVKWALNRPQY